MANPPVAPKGGTGFARSPGFRVMKEYPLTSKELWTLGGLQFGSGAAFSAAGWLAGFCANAKQATAFAGRDTAPQVIAQWKAYSDMSWWGSLLLAILGIILFAISAINVWGIIKETTHA